MIPPDIYDTDPVSSNLAFLLFIRYDLDYKIYNILVLNLLATSKYSHIRGSGPVALGI